MTASSASPERAGGVDERAARSSSGVSASSSSIPITPFSGVRISWLMLARKSDLAARPRRLGERAVALGDVGGDRADGVDLAGVVAQRELDDERGRVAELALVLDRLRRCASTSSSSGARGAGDVGREQLGVRVAGRVAAPVDSFQARLTSR